MKGYIRFFLALLIACATFSTGSCQQAGSLKIVIIRHGEKPDDGDNLNCQGFNRALALPKVLFTKFGIASSVFVPMINLGDKTKSARMFQTVTPYAVRYNLQINSNYKEDDNKQIAKDVRDRSGTVVMVWEHKAIPKLAKALGVKNVPDWSGDDFDSIWIITYKNDKAVLARDKEGLKPAVGCSF